MGGGRGMERAWKRGERVPCFSFLSCAAFFEGGAVQLKHCKFYTTAIRTISVS